MAMTKVATPKWNIVLMALIRGIHLEMDFDKWLKVKSPTAMEEIYRKVTKYPCLEEAYMTVGKAGGRQSTNVVQSNVFVK